MALEVIMPRVDMDMTEGKIAFWYVKNGDAVVKGQALFDIETDKATMEVEAHGDGFVQGIVGDVGSTLPVGTIVAWILSEGENLPSGGAPKPHPDSANGAVNPEPVLAPHALAPSGVERSDNLSDALMRATPLARSLARAHEIDLTTVKGSGPLGRVMAADLRESVRTNENSGGPGSPTEGYRLHSQWLIEGAGTPLVLIHGFGADLGSWKPFAAHISGQATVALDLPNHGKSPVSATRTLADIAARALNTLDALGVAEFHVLGHSLGGAVALAILQLSSSRVKSLTLLAPAGLGPDVNGAFIEGLCRAENEAALRPWMTELVSDASVLTPSFIATAHKQLASPDKRAALRAMAQTLMPYGTQAESVRHTLAGVRVPAKVIWGSDDRIIPLHHGLGLPGQVGLHTLRGVGHLPQVEQPQLVAQLLAEQLRH